MRQKLLFTLVALALGAFSSLNAQNNLTVYEGEATSAYVPVYGFYADAFQKIDMVMPAADLSEMEGGTINSITWYLASPAAEAWGGNFQIYMTEVAETTPTTYFDETNATLVYEGPLDGTSEKLSIELATPYAYQGGNLLIAVRQTEEGTYKSATFKGSEVAGAAIQGYSYSSLDAVNLNVRDFLPQTLFEYTPGSGVLYKPKNLQVTNIGTDAATLTWEPGSTETSWNIECKKAADEEWTAVGAATATTYTLEDLTKATLYDVRVQADYGDGNLSGWVPTSFATLACEESDMGEVEYSLTDSYGDGWNAGGKLQICYAGTNIVVQELALPSGNSAEGTFKLCYGVDYDLNWVGGSYLYEVGFVLTGPEGETIYEQTPSSSSEATLAAGTLVTFQIHMNTCPRPTDVVASNVTYNSATISWTPGTDEQDLFEVAYGLPGFDPETATPVQANAATINLTELAENAAYDVYVRSICTADDHSIWSKVYTFTTPLRFPLPVDLEINDITAKSANATWGGDAQAYNFRYRPKTTIDESFEGEELPASWTLNNWVLMPITQYNMGGTPLFAADGESCLASVSINDQTGEAIGVDNWLISPKSDLGGTLEFYVGDLGANYVENFSVYVSTTGTAIADFTPLAENVTTAGSMVSAPEAWAKKEFDLSAYEGQSGYIAIRHHDAAGYYLFVDAVKINGVEGAEWTVLNNVNPPVAMEGLTPGTTYEAQVQGVYEDGNSLWTDVVNFTTLAADAMPENLTITDVTATSATAEWIGSQDTYNLRYRTAAIKNGVNEDFTGYETGAVPTGWTLIDADGDGQNWYVWNLTLDDGTVQTTFSSNSYINNYGPLTPDDWAIAPQTKLGAQVSFDAWGQDPSYAAEHFQVYVSTTGTDIADFTPISDEIIATGVQTTYTFDLGENAGQMGYIAIRHFNCTDMYILNVSNFYMPGEEEDVPAGEWIVLENVTSPATITGLKPATTYEAQVQGIVNRDTEWTNSVFFTTEDAQFFVVGGFNGWDWSNGLAIDPTEGATFDVVNDPADVESMEFKIITFDEEGRPIWIGGLDENDVNYFEITDELLGNEIDLYDDGANFRLLNEGNYTVKLVEEEGSKALVEGLKMVVLFNKPVTTGVNDINGKAVSSVKYVNLAGVESDKPFDGVNIVVTTYTDGTKAAAKVIK